MERARIRLSLAILLATTVLPAVASAVMAECGNLAIDPIDHVNVGAAFLATVTEVSDDVDLNPNANPSDVHVEMSIEDVYHGSAPDALSFNQYDGGCGEFQSAKLEIGDKIIVAVEDLPLSYLPAPPFEGHIVVWRKVGGAWKFFEEALAFGPIPEFYPGAPRDASTKAEILQVIANWTLPSTSTAFPATGLGQDDSMAWMATGFAFSLLIALRRFRPRPM